MKNRLVRTLAITLAAAALFATAALAAPASTDVRSQLTTEQIEMLQALPYTKPASATGYADAKDKYAAVLLAFFYGTDRDTFGTFSNAHDHLYRVARFSGSFSFAKLGTVKTSGSEDFFAKVAEEASAELEYTSDNLKVEFLTDPSCIYQPDCMDRLLAGVRGIAKIHLYVKPSALTGTELAMLTTLGFTQLEKNRDQYIPVDVHMNIMAGMMVHANTILPAGEAY